MGPLAIGISLLFRLFRRDNNTAHIKAATPQTNAITAITITAIAQPGKCEDDKEELMLLLLLLLSLLLLLLTLLSLELEFVVELVLFVLFVFTAGSASSI